MRWELESAVKSRHARFTARIKGFVLAADHPDVYDAGILEYDADAGTLEGFIHLHRRRSVKYIRKWILPGPVSVFRVRRSEIAQMHARRQTSSWCPGVFRRMHDLRAKEGRE